MVNWNLQRDIGMTCGGEVTFLFEVHHQSFWSVTIFGAGHVSQSLSRVLLPLSCQLTVVDTREEWINKLPEAVNLKTICTPHMFEEVKNFSSDTYFVLMTQGHAFDLPILEEIFKTHPQAPYIGVIGSDVKALKIKNELKEKKFPSDLISRLHCPMGLTLGTNHPQEIAISISAELIQIRDQQ